MTAQKHPKSNREREFDRKNREAAERVLANERNKGSGLWEWAQAVLRKAETEEKSNGNH